MLLEFGEHDPYQQLTLELSDRGQRAKTAPHSEQSFIATRGSLQ
jgi:hypothetical protein